MCTILLATKRNYYTRNTTIYSIHVFSVVIFDYVDCTRHPKVCKVNFVNNMRMLHFSSPAPTGPPLNFTVTPGARSMTFSWAPPNATQRNGMITGYSLSCTPQTAGGDITMQYTQDGTFPLEGFTPATMYSCSIFASNSQGNGPVASMIIITLEDCKFPFSVC